MGSRSRLSGRQSPSTMSRFALGPVNVVVSSQVGPLSRIVGATIRDTANPTMLSAGYKANVIPSVAEPFGILIAVVWFAAPLARRMASARCC